MESKEINVNSGDEKLTDKAFLRLMIVSFLKIIVCILCLIAATLAWYL